MPTISIFIRQHDLPKWQALDSKSQWLHDNLLSVEGQTPVQAEQTWEDMILGQIEDYGLHPSDKPGYAINDNGEYVRYTVFNDKVTIAN